MKKKSVSGTTTPKHKFPAKKAKQGLHYFRFPQGSTLILDFYAEKQNLIFLGHEKKAAAAAEQD